MIIYNDILQKLADAGYNTYRIRKENILPQSTLQRLREGKSITLDSLNIICRLTGCKIEELIEYRED